MENNKLIAEFMGYRECPMKLYRMNDEFEDITIYSTFQDEDEYLTIESGKIQIKFSPNQMRFHESWDWLMPVVQKIELTYVLSQDFLNLYSEKVSFERVPQEMFNISLFSDISEVYNTVVEFINEYNKKK